MGSGTHLPMTTDHLMYEVGKDNKPFSYLTHGDQSEMEDHKEFETPTNKLADEIKIESFDEDCGLIGNKYLNSYFESNTELNDSNSFGIKHLPNTSPKTEDAFSALNSDVNCNTTKLSFSCSESSKSFKSEPSVPEDLLKSSTLCFTRKKGSLVKLEEPSQNQVGKEKKSIQKGVCEKIFRPEGKCEKDTNVLTRKRPFSCVECGYKFNQKTQLTIHMRVHTGDRPFSCNECEGKFSQLATLKDHMRRHTGEKPFGCDQCGQKFSRKITLTTHRRVHTGDKPFVCEECGQKFSQSSSLIRHVRIHTGDKPFGCEQCGQKFSRKPTLTEHMKIHTGEKPFKCSKCGKTFSRRNILTDHMRIHTGVKPFPCRVCGELFRWQRSLKTHLCVQTK